MTFLCQRDTVTEQLKILHERSILEQSIRETTETETAADGVLLGVV